MNKLKVIGAGLIVLAGLVLIFGLVPAIILAYHAMMKLPIGG